MFETQVSRYRLAAFLIKVRTQDLCTLVEKKLGEHGAHGPEPLHYDLSSGPVLLTIKVSQSGSDTEEDTLSGALR